MSCFKHRVAGEGSVPSLSSLVKANALSTAEVFSAVAYLFLVGLLVFSSLLFVAFLGAVSFFQQMFFVLRTRA